MNDLPRVDFIIIGAQKSGTTSLFRYLSSHPDIYMPGEKELEFFSDNGNYTKGVEWYLNQYFSNNDKKSKGEASTHYMMYGRVPERIKAHFPDVKLIALLRNPIDRAFSHYRMSVRRGTEENGFGAAVRLAAQKGAIPDEQIDHNREYLFFGQYGRILSSYLEHFDRGNIKIIFSEELLSKPAEVIKDLYGFLGVDDGFLPGNINKKYHISGNKRIPDLEKKLRSRIAWLKRQKLLARHLLWRINFEKLIFWIETQWNVKKDKNVEEISKADRNMLKKYFQADVKLLESIAGRKCPWPDFS